MESEKWNNYVTCPHCGYVDEEIREIFFDGDVLSCNNCGEDFGCTSHVDVLFVTFKLKDNEGEDKR